MVINKSKFNLLIDSIMFIIMMAIAGMGFLIKYVLVPGFKRSEVYGKNVELHYLGLDRHQWGSIHLGLSFLLFFLLLIHIFFHWKQIISIYKKMVVSKISRFLFAIVFVFLSLLFGIAPLFIMPEIVKRGEYNNHISESQEYLPVDTLVTGVKFPQQPTLLKKQEYREVEINGKMTLNEVAIKFEIPISELCNKAGVSMEKADERLGKLKKKGALNMSELRRCVEQKVNPYKNW